LSCRRNRRADCRPGGRSEPCDGRGQKDPGTRRLLAAIRRAEGEYGADRWRRSRLPEPLCPGQAQAFVVGPGRRRGRRARRRSRSRRPVDATAPSRARSLPRPGCQRVEDETVDGPPARLARRSASEASPAQEYRGRCRPRKPPGGDAEAPASLTSRLLAGRGRVRRDRREGAERRGAVSLQPRGGQGDALRGVCSLAVAWASAQEVARASGVDTEPGPIPGGRGGHWLVTLARSKSSSMRPRPRRATRRPKLATLPRSFPVF